MQLQLNPKLLLHLALASSQPYISAHSSSWPINMTPFIFFIAPAICSHPYLATSHPYTPVQSKFIPPFTQMYPYPCFAFYLLHTTSFNRLRRVYLSPSSCTSISDKCFSLHPSERTSIYLAHDSIKLRVFGLHTCLHLIILSHATLSPLWLQPQKLYVYLHLTEHLSWPQVSKSQGWNLLGSTCSTHLYI